MIPFYKDTALGLSVYLHRFAVIVFFWYYFQNVLSLNAWTWKDKLQAFIIMLQL